MKKLTTPGERAFLGYSNHTNFMKYLILVMLIATTPGCMVGYLLKSSYHQQKLLRSRVPIKEVISDKSQSKETLRKLKLVQDVKSFAEAKLGLTKTKNYNSFVQLDHPFVTWIVRASESYKLEPYKWWFPIVGHVPYKGYFIKKQAHDEASYFDSSKYDTYVRGVTAFSSLGWFDDPILSSMLRYQDHDLVELIIHESVHATLFIKDHADFNEQLATFIGQEGAKLYYLNKEGESSATIKTIENSLKDSKIFSKFISTELKELRTWYEKLSSKQKTTSIKKKRISQIQKKFSTEIEKQMLTKNYSGFKDRALNNAILLSYETYIQDLSDFKKFFELNNKNFNLFLEQCRKLEDSDNPKKDLKRYISKAQTANND